MGLAAEGTMLTATNRCLVRTRSSSESRRTKWEKFLWDPKT